MMGPMDFLHPYPARHFKMFKVLLIYFTPFITNVSEVNWSIKGLNVKLSLYRPGRFPRVSGDWGFQIFRQ